MTHYGLGRLDLRGVGNGTLCGLYYILGKHTVQTERIPYDVDRDVVEGSKNFQKP